LSQFKLLHFFLMVLISWEIASTQTLYRLFLSNYESFKSFCSDFKFSLSVWLKSASNNHVTALILEHFKIYPRQINLFITFKFNFMQSLRT
jgi:hypothetical protein